MLGTNERDHAWMDEGLNSYFEFRYEAEKYRTNAVFGDQIPADIKQLSEQDFQATVYSNLSRIPIQPAMETTSAKFKNDGDYSLTVYVKPAEWMYMLEKKAGRDNVDSAYHNYFNEWKFKHPQPADMRVSFEEALHMDLASYFALLNKEDKLSE